MSRVWSGDMARHEPPLRDVLAVLNLLEFHDGHVMTTT